MMLRKLITFRLAIIGLAVLSAQFFGPYDSSGGLDWPTQQSSSWADRLVRSICLPLANWDGVYMLRIADVGYTHEHFYAFFPGYPLLIRALGSAMEHIGLLSRQSAFLLAAVVISNVSYVMAGLILLKLSPTGSRAVWLFMLTPANIFMSAAYTESVFALFVFAGVYFLMRNRLWTAAASFFVATWIRSNGALLAVLFVLRWKPVHAIIVGLPLLMHNASCFVSFCPGSPFCSDLVPNCYAYIQTHYWHNGLFAYWTPNNIPNFLLAIPMILICVLLARNAWRCKDRLLTDVFVQLDALVAALGVLCVLTMNVQVITRFLAVYPNVYITLSQEHPNRIVFRLIVFFFVSYSLLGALLFPIFYPWT